MGIGVTRVWLDGVCALADPTLENIVARCILGQECGCFGTHLQREPDECWAAI